MEIGAADTAKQSEYPEPLTFTGTLRLKAGKVTSDNETIGNLIGYLGETADLFAHNSKLDGTQITIKPNPLASSAYQRLKDHCQVDEVFVRPNGSNAGSTAETSFESKEIEANVLVPLLSAVIEGGRDALGPHADIRALTSDRSVPIHDFLATLHPHISADDPELQLALNQKILENKDLSAKLGAETLLQIATHKQFSGKGLLASLGVSAGLGATWELWGSHVIKHAAFGKSFSPSRFGLQLAGIDSVPPLIIETMDTVVVLAIIKT
ncbi:hypothetical protein R69746_08193 [Paraburkholderia aspalathi]|uniref:hypothetical protein n=1 Tax=Paraburkholderia aspalathi TaxID=1324617 RepID=UPI00190B5D52|nr:hypothetical protein [Paraburkholderia aspalathi]MBK3844130.1 hypothetical protein [Paraburkholderia aspalathi]CAE6867533.1 hypothetical protein R69746_08193 [Paraburkholderia aspalathi]